MIVTILQPAYLPWLGYFERIARSDLFISLDHVSMDASSKTKFANRNKIRTPEGWTWLTVPVKSKGRHGDMALDTLETDLSVDWARKHSRGIELNYRRAPYFEALAPRLWPLYENKWPLLVPLCDEIHALCCEQLGIRTPMLKSSALGITSVKDRLILDLCLKVGATSYVSGPFGRDYLDPASFESAGISLLFHDYAHPTYAQAHAGFEPYMCALDLILNHGPEAGRIMRTDKPFARE